jgi:hypothetical protein
MFLHVRPNRMLATVFLSLIANCCRNASLVMLIGAVRMALMVASSFALLGLLMGVGCLLLGAGWVMAAGGGVGTGKGIERGQAF